MSTESGSLTQATPREHYFRFHVWHSHLGSVFGNDWFALKAEAFAHFDVYPFILLNLAFSLQAAYAAPLILLAQTRQADRDKALTDADAQHREALAQAATERQELAAK